MDCDHRAAVRTIYESILERAVALIDANLALSNNDTITLPWGFQQNRPALRPLAHLAFGVLEDHNHAAGSAAFITLAEKLLSLNRNANHGIRERLSRAYLLTQRSEATVALTDRFCDDFCGVTLNRVLALLTVGREADTRDELAAKSKRVLAGIKMLLAKSPRAPKSDNRVGIRVGGTEQAWLYRTSSLSLWQRDGALDWLKRNVEAVA